MKRRFRGLRRAPDAAYDAVVVGSGVGGLVAANLLVRGGLKVLLVEQHYMPGGYCSTFRRGGFTFDASTHFYPLLGNRETLTGRLLADLGVETEWIAMDPVDVFHFPDGGRFEVDPDFDTYLGRVKAAFPHESAALDAFFAAAREAYLLGLLCYFRGRDSARLGPYRDLTVRDALDRWIGDERLKLLLTADCPHWGSPPCRTSFAFDSMLRLSYFLGNYYPRGGSQAFADELVRTFEEAGGHVMMSTAARRVVVEGGAVRGVELETLRGPIGFAGAVRAEAVVSNADLLWTYEHLVGRRHLPPDLLPALERLRPTFPCWLTHIGLEGVPDDELAEVQGYHWDGWDPDRVGLDALRFKLFIPTLLDPTVAPPGRQVIVVQKVQEMDFAAVDDWQRHKHEVEQFVFGHLERMLPGIGKRILVATSATAGTARRFTGNFKGAMLGWEMSPGQLGEGRPAIDGVLPGLFVTGHWTRPGGGITPVIVSAQLAAERVLQTASGEPGAKGDLSTAEGRAHQEPERPAPRPRRVPPTLSRTEAS